MSSSRPAALKTAVLGVGNPLHSDDGAGPRLTDLLSCEKESGISAFNCGTAPENFTGVIRKLHPDLLIIADASLMNESPGALRRIPPEKITDAAVGTHMLPLSHLFSYLQDCADTIMVIGIQPASLEDGDELSPEVEDAVRRLKELILSGKTGSIPLF